MTPFTTIAGLDHIANVTQTSQQHFDRPAFGLGTLLARPLGAALRSFEKWQRRRTTIRQLAALNDHLLRDIGISRHGISAE